MKRLAFDIGNSCTKVGIFFDKNIICTKKILSGNEAEIVDIVKNQAIAEVIISSVVKEKEEKIKEIISPYIEKIFFLDSSMKLPFENLYQTPETLGKDRIAAVAGAQFLFPDKNILVIDAGTAITYDLLVDNKYLGGNISAGLDIRLKSLNFFTSQLPLVEIDEKEIDFFGKNSREAILAGAINGILFEIEGYRDFCKKNFKKNLTIITGGNANYFVKKIKSPIFANSNLVIIGLKRILEFNNEDIRKK